MMIPLSLEGFKCSLISALKEQQLGLQLSHSMSINFMELNLDSEYLNVAVAQKKVLQKSDGFGKVII
jgi:hypothetical protein